jgi:ABC-type phosphate transport system permease subunit
MVDLFLVIASIVAFVLVSKNTIDLNKNLGFGIFQSILISVLFLLPTSVSIIRSLLGIVESLLNRLVFILGGTDQEEIAERIIAAGIGKN